MPDINKIKLHKIFKDLHPKRKNEYNNRNN